MRWSETFIPTLRHAPADAVAVSHKLMVRAGLVRQMAGGSYAYLPMGLRALRKVSGIVREEMNRLGALEVRMPALWPEEMMRKTGRLESFADDLLRLEDRRGRPHLLAPTHEEAAVALLRDDVQSYKSLPLTVYQIQTKFRDEPRPRFGLVRTREFLMKDAYSFCADGDGLDAGFMGSDGRGRPFLMGCYGLGMDRILAAVVETAADEQGIVWPPAVAPCEVIVIALGPAEQAVRRAAEEACRTMEEAALDVLLDDRDASPGVKFNDADLLGFPLRVVVGRRFMQQGTLELQVRRDGTREDVAPERLSAAVRARLESLSATRSDVRTRAGTN